MKTKRQPKVLIRIITNLLTFAIAIIFYNDINNDALTPFKTGAIFFELTVWQVQELYSQGFAAGMVLFIGLSFGIEGLTTGFKALYNHPGVIRHIKRLRVKWRRINERS